MDNEGSSRVEVLVGDMKHSIDKIWALCRKNVALNSMLYTSGHFSEAQYSEIKEIVRILGCLKRQIDSLAEECAPAPATTRADAADEVDKRTLMDFLREFVRRDETIADAPSRIPQDIVAESGDSRAAFEAASPK